MWQMQRFFQANESAPQALKKKKGGGGVNLELYVKMSFASFS